MNIVALIPARAGSKRIPGKNIKPLGGKPLIQWTIEAAQQSGIFSAIGVSTEDDAICQVAWDCGALTWRRRWEYAQDDSPDIQWVRDVLQASQCREADAFAILRPTSPFRTAETIRRAWAQLRRAADCADSLRAIQPVREHPFKMWTWEGEGYPMKPFRLAEDHDGTPWHSKPTQTLPKVYVQNASLEMSWTSNVEVHGTISGRKVVPFFTEGWEGFDINDVDDWNRAEAHAQTLLARV